MQDAYNNLEAAFEHATDTVGSISDSNGWSDDQYDIAMADVTDAYDANDTLWSSYTGFVADISDSIFGYDAGDIYGYDPAEKAALSFWTDLGQRASKNWKSFPNGTKAISWITSASHTASIEVSETEDSSALAIAEDTAVKTAEDIGAIGKKIGEVASNPAVWYGLAAAALLGSIVYIRGIFR